MEKRLNIQQLPLQYKEKKTLRIVIPSLLFFYFAQLINLFLYLTNYLEHSYVVDSILSYITIDLPLCTFNVEVYKL